MCFKISRQALTIKLRVSKILALINQFQLLNIEHKGDFTLSNNLMVTFQIDQNFILCCPVLKVFEYAYLLFMSYTRKEIISWVESQTKYKFQQLRNGVFFCRMLTIKFPEESNKFKYNPAPLSEYDYTSNLTAMKKLLNKKGLQQNLNITQVLNSKNNFELAKWFKSLIDNLIIINNQSLESYSSVNTQARDTLGPRIQQSQKLKLAVETPRKRLNQSFEEKRKLESAEKQKNVNSRSKAKRLSMAKSQNYFFKQKMPSLPVVKIPICPDKHASKSQAKINETQILNKTTNIQVRNREATIQDLLYERALQESIQSFEKILQKIKDAASDTQIQNYYEYRDSILNKILHK